MTRLSPHGVYQKVEHPFELLVAASQRRRLAHPDDRGDHVLGVDVGAQAVVRGTGLEDLLGSAFPGREKVTDNPTVQAVAAELGATPAQVGVAWLLAEYEDTLVITGTSDPAHLAENIAAGGLRLPPETLEALNRVASG